MRVPVTGQPLFERRIVREGMMLAERMLDGYSVTSNGGFIHSNRLPHIWATLHFSTIGRAVSELFQRASKSRRHG